MSFELNKRYTWKEICDGVKASGRPLYYLLYGKSGDIAAACLRIDTNPRAPYEIWAGKGREIRRGADKLVAQTDPIPVFVQELDEQWYFRGMFRVIDALSDPAELSLRGHQAGRDDIYKIILMERTFKESVERGL